MLPSSPHFDTGYPYLPSSPLDTLLPLLFLDPLLDLGFQDLGNPREDLRYGADPDFLDAVDSPSGSIFISPMDLLLFLNLLSEMLTSKAGKLKHC